MATTWETNNNSFSKIALNECCRKGTRDILKMAISETEDPEPQNHQLKNP